MNGRGASDGEPTRARIAFLEDVVRIADAAAIEVDVASQQNTFCTSGYLRVHGLPGDALPESREEWLRRIHPDDRARAESAIGEVLQGTGTSFENTYRIVRGSDGAVRSVRVRGEVERDEQGRAQRIVAVHSDVTDQKLADEARAHGDGLHAFIVRLNDALRAAVDPLEVQERAARLLGEHLGASRVAFGEIESDETCVVRRCYCAPGMPGVAERVPVVLFGEAMLARYRRGEDFAVSDVCTSPDFTEAERIPYQESGVRAVAGVMLVKNGRSVASFCVDSAVPRAWSASDLALVRTVAERGWAEVERAQAEVALRESERRYRTLVETMSEGFSLVEAVRDAAGNVADIRYLAMNARFQAMTGLTPAAIGRLRSEVLGHEPEVVEAISRILETGVPERFERQLPTSDRWFDVTIVPAGGERVTGVWNDITLRREKERRKSFMLALNDGLRPLADVASIQSVASRLLAEELGVDPAHLTLPPVNDGTLLASVTASVARRRPWTAFEVSLIEAAALRMWAEAAMCESENRYRTLFEAMREGFAVVEALRDETGHISDLRLEQVNDRFEALTDSSRADVVARSGGVPPLDREILGSLERVLVSGEPERLERFVPAANRWYDVRLSAVGVDRVSAVFDDITAQKDAEAALRDSDRRKSFLLALSDALRSVSDTDLIQDTVNRLLGEQLGVSRVCYVEYPANSGLAVVRRDFARGGARSHTGTYRLADFGALVTELAKGRTVVTTNMAESALYQPEATVRAASVQVRAQVAVPLVKEGNLVSALSVSQSSPRAWTPFEIALIEETAERTWAAVERAHAEAARREGEERLRLALDSAAMGTFVWHVRGDLSLPDARTVALMGESASQSFGPARSLGSDVHPDDAARYAIAVSRALDPEGDGRLREDVRVSHHGAERWLAITGRVYFEGEPRVAQRMAGTVVDITDHKTLERTLRASEAGHAFLLALNDRLRTLDDAEAIRMEAVRIVSEHMGAVHALYTEDTASALGGDVAPALRAGWPLVVSDVDAPEAVSSETRARCHALGVRAFAVLPVVKSGVLRGCLSVECAEPRAWSPQEIILLENVAERTWTASERALAQARLRQARRELEARVAERTAALAAEVEHRNDLTRRLASAQEAERKRIARELHDSVGQLLGALGLAAKVVSTRADLPAPAAENLAEMQRLIDTLGREVHGLAVRLRPTSLDDIGLPAALTQLTSDWSASTGIPVDLEVAALERERLGPDSETALYRIVQEALTNVTKHASAKQVSVVVRRHAGSAIAIVEDDGAGFDPETTVRGRLGLVGMRERMALIGGSLEVESVPGQGTTIIARIPLSA